MNGTPEQIAGMAEYLFELGMLKHAKRSGWWIADAAVSMSGLEWQQR